MRIRRPAEVGPNKQGMNFLQARFRTVGWMVPCQAGGRPLNLAQRVTSFTWSDSTEGRVPVVVRTQSVRLQGFAARQDPLRVKNSSYVSSRTPAPGRTRSMKIIVRVLQGQASFQQSLPCVVFLTWRGRPLQGGMTRPASSLPCPPDNPEAQLGSRLLACVRPAAITPRCFRKSRRWTEPKTYLLIEF